jgi:putative spermidine/putrescine transport system substrate-binding protein
MNRMLRLAAAAGCAAVVALDAGAAFAQACTQMQVYLSIFPRHREDVMEVIAPQMRARHNVELVAEAIGSVNMVERIQAQGANPRVSIAHWDLPVGVQACEQGLCRPIDLARAPNAQRLYDWAYSKDAQGRTTVLATNVVGVGIIYREDEFRRRNLAPPTSWADLRRPELRGRIAITAPQSTWGTAALVMMARNGGGGEGNIEAGFAATRALQPSLHSVFTWTSELANLWQLGEVWVAVTGNNMAPTLSTSGTPTRFVAPSEGAPNVPGGVSLVNGGPCEAAAYDYLNVYYSDDFQRRRMVGGGVPSPSRTAWEGVTDPASAGVNITPADFGKLVTLDWATVNAARPAWMQRWQREIR